MSTEVLIEKQPSASTASAPTRSMARSAFMGGRDDLVGSVAMRHDSPAYPFGIDAAGWVDPVFGLAVAAADVTDSTSQMVTSTIRTRGPPSRLRLYRRGRLGNHALLRSEEHTS